MTRIVSLPCFSLRRVAMSPVRTVLQLYERHRAQRRLSTRRHNDDVFARYEKSNLGMQSSELKYHRRFAFGVEP